MTSVPSIEDAIAALDEELGKAGARTRGGRAGPPPRETRRPENWINWRKIADWLYANPGKAFTADPVHANSVYRFRKNFPDIRVEGSNHRLQDSGRRVATLYAIYEPADDPDWADA